MQINKLTFIGLYLNGALGSGKYDDISIDEVKEEIESHTVFDYLHRKLGEDIDLGLLTPEDKRMLNKEWAFLADYVDEKRRMSVSKNGLFPCRLCSRRYSGKVNARRRCATKLTCLSLSLL